MISLIYEIKSNLKHDYNHCLIIIIPATLGQQTIKTEKRSPVNNQRQTATN